MYAFFAFVAGLMFGIGLIVSGMASPAKVLGFLDLAGRWDPSLALVMAGAIAVGVIGFNFAVPGGVAPGQVTQVLEIQTNATSFMRGTLQIIDSSVASVTAFEPCPVPEAGSLGLTLLGGLLLATGFLGRRRKTSAGPAREV